MKTVLHYNVLGAILALFSWGTMAKDLHSLKELRVRLSYNLPVDPAYVQTMADYDLSLVLSRTWFNYDVSRKAIPGLIKAWEFDNATGGYTFKIDPEAKWSDGKSVTSDDLFLNLKRGIENPNSTYGVGMKGIVDIQSYKKKSSLDFFLATVSKKPSEAFFQRMGSVFWSVIDPEAFSENPFSKVTKNSRSLGPYKISIVNKEEVILIQNEYYLGNLKSSASKIHIRKVNESFHLEDFLDGKTWENYVQDSSLLEEKVGQKIVDKKFTMWTRGNDRISILKPHGSGELLRKRQNLSKIVGKIFHSKKMDLKFNVKKAVSLQPMGYPLNDDFDYSKLTIENKNLPKNIRILSFKSGFHSYHENILTEIFQDLGIKVQWDLKNREEYLKILDSKMDSDHDFDLSSFGVADPEPATWLGLVFGFNFIKFSKKDFQDFSNIAQHKSEGNEVQGFKKLLKGIQSDGGFVPLFFFSTLSLGYPEMNFSNINELDETVDYSKIIFK